MPDSVTEPVVFIGRVASALPLLRQKRQLRIKEILYYLDLCGAQSLPLVLLICFLMGGVLAINGQIQLSKFGSEIFIVDMVGFSVLKEFGPLMVALIATGQAGSAFASEIGTMKVDEEISALESELKTDYNITVEIKKAVTVSVNIDDGGTKASEQATFVKIGNRWCCMKAMEDIDFVCQNDGYNVW